MAPRRVRDNIPTFKLVLLGDSGTGKTTFIKRHLTGEFTKEYIATTIIDEHELKFYTTRGPIRFYVWDTAGQEKSGSLRYGYYIQAECAIILFDFTSHDSYVNVKDWRRGLTRTVGKIPIVLCGNKMDKGDREVNDRDFNYYLKKKVKPYSISVKTNQNIGKPFLWLARILVGDQRLKFVEAPAALPPEIKLKPEYLSMIASELKVAAQVIIPNSDDDI